MPKKIPLRKCIGCQEMKDKRQMIRIVKNKEGEIFVDSTGKKNGRGAYICPNSDCLEKAIKNRGLEKSFKENIPSDVYETLREAFENINER